MATEQVHQWIQNDLKLSKMITLIETDFSNGYLFGEILAQYNLIPDISSFTKKQFLLSQPFLNRTNKESKLKNFQQVESVLRQLKVKFDAKLINQIMNEERGAALRLLYQLKLGISKMNETQSFGGALRTMSNLKPNVVDQTWKMQSQLGKTLQETKGMSTMNKAAKLQSIEKKLLKFEHTKMQNQDKAWRDQQDELELIKKLYQDTRQDSLRKMEENKTFMNQWEEEGRKKWRTNKKIRQEAIARVKYFEDKEVQDFKNKLNRELDDATRDMMGGITEFEKNLEKQGIEKQTNMEDALKRMEEKKGVPPGQIQNFSYAATMNKIKEKKNQQDFAGKERDRRRRKLMVDQQKTQTELERKRNEEILIEKLKKFQEEEQLVAYLDERSQSCKELVLQNRVEKANENDEKKKKQQEELERKRNEEYAQIIDQHKKEVMEKKKYYQQVRREEKMKKRAFNIEVCSEIIDLILDVADEVQDKQISRGQKKFNKNEWKEWMDIFISNRKLSLTINDQSVSQSGIHVTFDEELEHQQIMKKQKPVTEIIDIISVTDEYTELMEYLGLSGKFYLNHIPCWNDLMSWSKDFVSIDFSVLKDKVSPSNEDLASQILTFLTLSKKQDKSQDRTITASHIPDSPQQELSNQQGLLPWHLPLKLSIIGRSFAGKRTIAKQLNEQYGGKIKILQMDEMIKECIDYSCPKPVAEAAPAKGGKAPPKGKQEEAPVDIYAGKDTSEYKEIGKKLKEIIGEEIPQGTDLQGLIADDTLLVKLLQEKLKLGFNPDKPESTKIEEMKQNIAKEKELQAQLAEIESQNQAAAAQAPADKGGAKKQAPPAKGGKGQGQSEDQIRAELEAIQKIPIEGFILLDFPRTVEQAKIIEENITGFKSMLDQPKSIEEKNQEAWTKVFQVQSPEQTSRSQVQVQKSIFDGVLIMDVGRDECVRRTQNRKIDPTTNTIYHLEDNPPPENDAKLKDRLQDYTDPESENQRMLQHHRNFEYNQKLMQKWYSSFGLYENEKIKPVQSILTLEVNEKSSKEDVLQLVNSKIKKIIDFKQEIYNQKKQNMIEVLDQEAQQQQEDEKKEEGDEVKKRETQIVTDDLDEDKSMKETKMSYKSKDVTKRDSQRSLYSKKSMRDTLNLGQLSMVTEHEKVEAWDELEKSFFVDSTYTFKKIQQLREQVKEGLNELQREFLEFLQRTDEKQGKINFFKESFNKFSEEFPDLREDEQTKEELMVRVNNLSNDLWTIIEKRKEESLNEYERLKTNGWIQSEMKKLLKHGSKIISIEVEKFITVFKLLVSKSPSMSINIEEQLNLFVNQGIQPYDRAKKTSPLLDKLLTLILSKLDKVGKEQHKISDAYIQILDQEKRSLLYRLNVLRTWMFLQIQEFDSDINQVFEIMDDWIVLAVERENEGCHHVINIIKTAIVNQTLRLDYQDLLIDDLQLYGDVQMIQFQVDEAPNYLRNQELPQEYTEHLYRYQDLELLYKQITQHSYEENLDENTFIHIMVLAFKELHVPMAWKYRSFKNIIRLAEQFRVAQTESQLPDSSQTVYRYFINWKHVMTVFIMLQVQMNDREQMKEYFENLSASCDSDGYIDKEAFASTAAWFDKMIGMPEEIVPVDSDYDDEEEEGKMKVDLQRVDKLKRLLYDIHKSNVGVLAVRDFQDCIEDLVSKAGFKEFQFIIFEE